MFRFFFYTDFSIWNDQYSAKDSAFTCWKKFQVKWKACGEKEELRWAIVCFPRSSHRGQFLVCLFKGILGKQYEGRSINQKWNYLMTWQSYSWIDIQKKAKTQGLKYSVYKRHKPKFTVKPKVAIYSFLIVEG